MEEASLNSLRQAMVETPQVFAAAYLGYPEINDLDVQPDPFSLMRENAPSLCEDLPFLLEIPRERILGNTGELYCIVPRDEDASVAVNKGIQNDSTGEFQYEEVVYRSESGAPILLFCNSDWEPDTEVVITDPQGNVTRWYPRLDDNQCTMPLRNDDWEDLFFDFTPYRELLLVKHSKLKAEDWSAPTAESLAGSRWVWYGYLKDGREVSYQLFFDEDTLSVIWNDGIDEADHEYLYTDWELTQEDGFGVLTINFGEFAGIRRYNLLHHEFYDELYVAMDTLQEDLPIGEEPLRRFLSKPYAPVTEPEQTQPSKVTVYLLEKTVFCDNGYSAYFYDDAYNVNTRKDYDIENKYLGRVNFIEKDKNGMACMIWEETRTENVHNLTYFEDGKLKEELLNVNESNYTGWQYEYDQKGDVVEKREYCEGILQSTVIYEYNGEELWRVYCEDPEDNHIYDCRVEGGRIIEKVVYSTDSVTGCSYRYEYDDNGNLIMEYLVIDGEVLPGTSYSYRVVEVDCERAGFLKKQQAYLVSIT